MNATFIVIILCMITSVVFSIISSIKDFYITTWEDYLIRSIFGGMCGLLIAIIMLVVIVTATFKSTSTITTKSIKTESLISMKFDNKMNGDFFLGTGTINNTEYVVFYTKNDKEVIRHKYKADNVKIMIDSKNPRAEITTQNENIKYTYLLGNLSNDDKTIYKIKLYIPKESIVENINLN